MHFLLLLLLVLGLFPSINALVSVDAGANNYYHSHGRLFWTFSQEQETSHNCPPVGLFDKASSGLSMEEKAINIAKSICSKCYHKHILDNMMDFEVTDSYTSKNGSLSHVYLRQVHLGRPILNALFSVHFSSPPSLDAFATNLDVVAYSSSVYCFKSLIGSFKISISKCLGKLISFLKLPMINVDELQFIQLSSIDYALDFESHPFYKLPIKATASWFYHAPQDALLPTWKFEITTSDGIDVIVGIVTIQKDSGKPLIISLNNWLKFLSPSSEVKYFDDLSSEKGHSNYLVYPLGVDSPSEGLPTTRSGPFSRTASPIGWNSIGNNGHSTNSTIGNNVFAQENHFGNDYWISHKRPVSYGSSFIYPISNWSDPYSYVNSSISNVFYWINLLHDILYTYGFDESAGNFQNKNFLRGGRGFDAVIADVQDGSGVYEWNFSRWIG